MFRSLNGGGGIKDLEHIKGLLNAGADKVCINSIVRDSPSFVTEASDIFGNQCITVSIDMLKSYDSYGVYDYRTGKKVNADFIEHLKAVELLGAGEILLNSVDRDGSR